ncbi:hypothetical protein SLA2020_016210 [Shorea laevis]
MEVEDDVANHPLHEGIKNINSNDELSSNGDVNGEGYFESMNIEAYSKLLSFKESNDSAWQLEKQGSMYTRKMAEMGDSMWKKQKLNEENGTQNRMREQANVWTVIQMGHSFLGEPKVGKEYNGPGIKLEENCGVEDLDD